MDYLKRQKEMNYILSYGGGVNSTALLFLIISKRLPLDYVVFADTGDELPSTYEYLESIKSYLKRKGIEIKIVKTRNSDTLYDRCERRRVIPSQIWRWCTRDLKVKPIHAFYRILKTPIVQYIGIDYGEIHRIKDSKEGYITNVYPLVDWKIDRNECIRIIQKRGFEIPVKSGCFFCPFNNVARWYEIYEQYPHLFDLAQKLEEGGKHMPKQKLYPQSLRTLREEFGNKIINNHIQVDNPCGSECMT